MKKIIILFLVAFYPTVNVVCQENNYTLHGQVLNGDSLNSSYLRIREYYPFSVENVSPIDSVKIENGRFAFSEKTDKPRLMYVASPHKTWGRFIAEPGKIKFSFNCGKAYLHANVSGTPINNDYQKLITGFVMRIEKLWSR